VEYFSRWIEAEPLGAITSAAVQKFVWKYIVCRFGVPKDFITDNGKQFDSDKFREMCEGLNLEIRFASVAHLQSNGAAEHTNGKILEALKKRLEGRRKANGQKNCYRSFGPFGRPPQDQPSLAHLCFFMAMRQ
jgi:Integrase core domain.